MQNLDSTAELLLKKAGVPIDQPPSLARLFAVLFGDIQMYYTLGLPGDASLSKKQGVWQLAVRLKLSKAQRSFAIAHELAEYWLGEVEHYSGEDIEEACNQLAAAILVPRRALHSYRLQSDSIAETARYFEVTQSLIALRIGELSSQPMALLSPGKARVRGPEGFAWPSEAAMRKLVKCPIPGLKVVRLEEEENRFLLVAEG